ncbi:hypothetical protein UFOVP94_26 [uncultured Caudovirales phage]|uniref:Uncharacterized protein n=1 Tax=uncultured Caudovirales phage TaxID=2100421 RepID=A0A6J5L4W8_9CAUD|nr:hypothetical protein UFOVP94_26 [uncultured Caudovirales phage]CAB5212451.1 hypothetical protein UFOVP186_17 [uncultured Caudovirales phage]
MKIKDYLASIGEDYNEYIEMKNTPWWQWTQAQQLFANMLHEAMNEKLIRNAWLGRN